MTPAAFIRSLPRDPGEALAQIEGALWGDRIDPQWSEGDRRMMVSEKVRLERDKARKR